MLADPNISGAGANGVTRHPPYWFPSSMFRTSSGTPGPAIRQWGGVTPRWTLWIFSTGDYDYVATEFLLPDYYDGEDITLTIYWSKDDAGAGDWRNVNDIVALAVGEVIITGGSHYSLAQILTVSGTTKALQKDSVTQTSPTFVAGDLLLIQVGRAGPAAADTYAGEILFMGASLDW